MFVGYSLALLISVLCLYLILRQRPGEGQKTVQTLTSFICVLMTGYWLSISASTLEGMVIAQKVIYVGGCYVYYYMLLFYLEFCRIKIPKIVSEMLQAFSFFMMLIAFTFDHHKLLYKSYYLGEMRGVTILEKEYGIAHHAYIAMMACYCIAFLVLAVRFYRNNHRKKERMQSLILLLVALCPTASYILQKTTTKVDLVPFGLCISLVLTIYLIYVERIYDVTGLAKDYVFSSIDDTALIVIDADQYYKGSNDLAKELFPVLRTASTTERLETLSQLLNDLKTDEDGFLLMGGRVYEPKVKTVQNMGKTVGSVIWITDVTVEREHIKLVDNYQKKLEHDVKEKTEHIEQIQQKIVLGMANIIENRDANTGGHIRRTSDVVSILVDAIRKDGQLGLSDEFCETIVRTAPLHDLGKIAVDDRILRKPGKYTPEEFEIMKTHTTKGAQILPSMLRDVTDEDTLRIACNIAKYHHEKWNGNGYPEHLSGENIPIEARIMAIADVYDALVSERCYKEAMSFEQAYGIITESMGSHFDPSLEKYFIQCRPQLEDYYTYANQKQVKAAEA